MSATFTQDELKRFIDQTTDRLPKEITVKGKTLKLDIKYFGGLDNFWVLSYGTSNPKDCFIHRDESTLEACVLGAWRKLALKKDEWDFVKEQS